MISKTQLEQIQANLSDVAARMAAITTTDWQTSADFKAVNATNPRGDRVPICIMPTFPFDGNNVASATFISHSATDIRFLLDACKFLLEQYSTVEMAALESLRLQKTEFEAFEDVCRKLKEVQQNVEQMQKMTRATNEFVHSSMKK